jgi:hypothetical protein
LLQQLKEDNTKLNPNHEVIRKWNKMTVDQKLVSALPYPRETGQSELYDMDDIQNSEHFTEAQLDKQLDDYFKRGGRNKKFFFYDE